MEMEKSLLNGFAFTSFRQLEDGSWVLADIFRWGRVLPTPEFGRKLRRRILAGWGAVFALAAGVAVASGDPFEGTLLVAFGPLVLSAFVYGTAERLPRSSYRFSRREVMFQLRGFVALFAVLVLASSALCLGLWLTLSDRSLLAMGATLALLGGLLAACFWRVRTAS